MTLTTLLTNIGIAAILLTLIVAFFKKGHKNWVLTYLQNFTGILFIFSGWVKAVDPLGTAYKMEQYFAEFASTFEGTWFSFISPIFPFFSTYSISFSVFMIVLEIILGLMLVMGHRSKFTSWAFFLLVAFFTVLTGFTFLTGYVPSGVNFFSFSGWGEYDVNNMKVTDCGCFGDFIKLEPKVSFFKDIALLFPAIFFLFKHKDMHQWFSDKTREIIIAVSIVGLFFYCFSNYVWDIPHTDFRPFKKGVNVTAQYDAEITAMGNVQILKWKLENQNSGKVVELSNDVYMKEFANYPKEEWKIIDQVKSEPTVKKTKISDFDIEHVEGYSAYGDYLESEGYKLMIVAYKLDGVAVQKEKTRMDTIYIADTIKIEGESMTFEKRRKEIKTVNEKYYDYVWKEKYLQYYQDKIKPFTDGAAIMNIETGIVAGQSTPEMIANLLKTTGVKATAYTADDILLKTIVRSNPGVVLWKDGTIVDKWHINKLPKWKEVVAEHNVQ